MSSYHESLIAGFQDELRKIAAQKVAALPAGGGSVLPFLGAAAVGGGLWEWARRANKDRQMGRAMRIQTGQTY